MSLSFLPSALIAASLFFGLAIPAPAEVVIAEIMAQNLDAPIVDEDGQHSDWIELHNTGPDAISLNGWYLSDDSQDLQKWRFPVSSPVVAIPPGGRLVVWCSGKNRRAAPARLHTNFSLAGNGEFLALVRADGFQVEHVYTPAFPPQYANSVYGVPDGPAPQSPTYLAAATPGAPNAGPLETVGPAIAGVTNWIPRPAPGPQAIVIRARVTPTLRPLAAVNPVVLKYRIGYGLESSLPMYDDGSARGHGDAQAGDAEYTAVIATTLGASQMLRWRIEARDGASSPNYSYAPPYPFGGNSPPTANPPPVSAAADVDQYHGTVSGNPALASSRLAILEWFTSDAAATRTAAGASCSFYYLDRFYDNVHVNIHGLTTATFPVDKKSHNLNFTRTNRFVREDGQLPVRSLNLLTNYGDKTKLRNGIAWRFWSQAQHLMSHWWEPVRVQQNGVFWGVYDMVEDGNEDMLQRFGFAPYDALYKINDATTENISGAEQKTREDIDTSKSDYQEVIDALLPSVPLDTKRQWTYDNVDIASMVNMVAGHTLINSADWGHKNYYAFRNTTGTGEWSILPWDQDLSLGHSFTVPGGYFSDEIDSQYGFRPAELNGFTRVARQAPEINRMVMRRLRTLMDETLVSGTATGGWFENEIAVQLDRIDPPEAVIGSGVKSDQRLDFERWGFWLHLGSTAQPFTHPSAIHHTARAQAARLTTSNPVPSPYPGSASGSSFGTNTTWPFLQGRRRFLYNVDGQNPLGGNDPIPAAQPAIPAGVSFETVVARPDAGSGGGEYFVLKNSGTDYIDLSGWSIAASGSALDSAFTYTFRGGTVLPPHSSGSALSASGDVHIGRLHVAKAPAAFRSRTASPTGGEYRFVMGPYPGRLGARGGSLTLLNRAGQFVASSAIDPSPTPAQQFLRVTELHFDPAPPSASEVAMLPGVRAGDFEFIELANTGAAPLDLSGARFDAGVALTFPAYTLQPGQRCLVIANAAAFVLRYPDAKPLVVGEFEDNLSNTGETIRLVDAEDEEVLSFTYEGTWYPGTDGGGRSLVTREGAPAFDAYGSPLAWAISDSPGGSPGTGDSAFANAYEGWRWEHFSQAEIAANVIASPVVDADGDGTSNLHAYAFGGSPRGGNGRFASTARIVTVDGIDYPAIEYVRRKNAIDLAFQVEVKGDLAALGGWISLDTAVGVPFDLGGGLERVVVRDTVPAGTPRYFRVRAIK